MVNNLDNTVITTFTKRTQRLIADSWEDCFKLYNTVEQSLYNGVPDVDATRRGMLDC
jgi:hypothetical protein